MGLSFVCCTVDLYTKHILHNLIRKFPQG